MRIGHRSIAANSALALAGDLAAKAGQLLVMVIAARTLPTSQLAILGTALAASGIAAVALDAGSGTLITRDGARTGGESGRLFVALAASRLPAALILVGAALVAGRLLGPPLVWGAAAALAVVGAASSSLIGLFRAQQDMRPEAAQKILFALLALAATGAAAALAPSAAALSVGLFAALAISLLPLAVLAGRPIRERGHARAVGALRRAAPLGLMAIATVVYYRSGTIALSLLSTPQETAAFTVASTVGFGLLMVPNAITTGLLPHLASSLPETARSSARRALHWSLALAAPVALVAAVAGILLLGPLFGQQYEDARLPLALLAVGVIVIAYNGVLGTALLAAGRVRAIGLQVGCSLAANLIALAVLVPRFGATGAAGATLVCELVAAALLTVLTARLLPGIVAREPVPARRDDDALGAIRA